MTLAEVPTEALVEARARLYLGDLAGVRGLLAKYTEDQPRDEAGRWTGAGGGDAKALDTALQHWALIDNHDIRMALAGKNDDPQARKDAYAIAAAVADKGTIAPDLYRGVSRMAASQGLEKIIAMQPGADLNLNIASWSSDPEVAKDFATGSPPRVVFRVAGAQALDMGRQSIRSEKEWITDGHFQVVSVEKDVAGWAYKPYTQGQLRTTATVVTLRQVDIFDAPPEFAGTKGVAIGRRAWPDAFDPDIDAVFDQRMVKNDRPPSKIQKAAATRTLRSGGAQRDASLNPIVARVREQLVALAQEHLPTVAKVSPLSLSDQAKKLIQQAYIEAYQVGFDDSGADEGDWDPEAAQAVADGQSSGLADLLLGLAGALLAGELSQAMADARMGQYAATLNPVYEQGFASGVTAQGQVSTATWHSEQDAEVCALCDERDGTVWYGDEDHPYPGEGTFGEVCEGAMNCFAPGTLVSGAFVSGMRSWYVGELVELRTASGRRVTVTPHHPVATPAGFVPAHRLGKGDQVLAERSAVEETASVHDENGPLPVEQVLDALEGALTVWAGHFTPRGMDLHGDALHVEGDVYVVGTDSHLRSDDEAKRAEPLRDLRLVTADMGQGARSANGAMGLNLVQDSTVSGSRPSGREELIGCLLPVGPTGGHAFTAVADRDPGTIEDGVDRVAIHIEGLREHLPRHSREVESTDWLDGQDIGVSGTGQPRKTLTVGRAAQVDASLSQPAGHVVDVDAEFVSELLGRYPGFVAPDEIVEVGRRRFAGHVYDLGTTTGWLVAGGILTANCRCEIWYDFVPADEVDQSDLGEEDVAAVARPAHERRGIQKYSEDQPRDEAGRFADGGEGDSDRGTPHEAIRSFEAQVAAEEHQRNPDPGHGQMFGPERGMIVGPGGEVRWTGTGETNRIGSEIAPHLGPGAVMTHFHPDEGERAHLANADLNTAMRSGTTIRAFNANGAWQQFTPNEAGVGSVGANLQDLYPYIREEMARTGANMSDAYTAVLQSLTSRYGTWAEGKASTGAVQKYSEDQPRDELGRFAPGSGEEDVSREIGSALADAKGHEREATSLVRGLGQATGGRMAGYDFRLKSESSLSRKLASDMADKGRTAAYASARIYDNLRYTLKFPAGQYTKGVEKTLANLRAQGYEVDRLKNFWSGGKGYAGVNAVIRSPDGYRWELQFHTQDSLDAKDPSHLLFERQRDPSTPRALKYELGRQITALWAPIRADTPPGATTIPGIPIH